MGEHLTAEQVSRYQQRSLPPAERLKLSDHLVACDACRRLVREHTSASPLLASTAMDLQAALQEEPIHLRYEEMAAYVDGTAGAVEREIVEGHSATCALCAEELRELAPFRDLLVRYPDQGYTPAASAPLSEASDSMSIGEDGALRLADRIKLPSAVREWVEELIATGLVSPTRLVRDALESLRRMATPAPLLAVRSTGNPVPLSPAFTAIRSVRPVFSWQAVPGAQEYRVTLAHLVDKTNRKVLWKGDAGTQTLVELPEDVVLVPGQSYLWQVVATVQGQPQPSPMVWFTLLSHQDVESVEAVEREAQDSPLAQASIYETYGLYAEALPLVERLAGENPDSASLQAMLQKLLQELGRQEAG